MSSLKQYICTYVCMDITYSKGKDQLVGVANPALCQLNRGIISSLSPLHALDSSLRSTKIYFSDDIDTPRTRGRLAGIPISPPHTCCLSAV